MFRYFPTNYVWNLSVDLAIEMGARIGEIEEMCAPLTEAAKQGDDAGTKQFMQSWVSMADKLCELGRFGQKTGAGWYDYQAGKRDAIPSDLVNKMIEDHRKEIGITPRKISDEEIVQRLVYSLVNEGAHILEDGIASKSGDIDMVYLTGYGFPIWRGGPMHYASQVGLFNVAESMKRFAKNPRDDASFWQPAALIQKLVAEGKNFS